MINIKNFSHCKINIQNFQIHKGHCCALLGRNNSGIQQLTKLLGQQFDESFQADILHLPSCSECAVMSHESIIAIYEHELKIDD